MNAAERLVALEALLARVQRNAAERRGNNGAAASLEPSAPPPAEPPRVEAERPAAVVRRSDRPADDARLERLLAKAWDTWGADPQPPPPETLTELLGQPVRRGPRGVEPVDAAPPAAHPHARDEPEMLGRSILAPELEEALMKAASERPPPLEAAAPVVPPPLASAPPPSIGPPPSIAPPLSSIPDSLGRTGLSRRRARLRRWLVLPRSAHRRSTTGLTWKQLGAALLVALPLVVGGIYLARREPTSDPGAPSATAPVRLDATSARVALDPAADRAPDRPVPVPIASSREPSAEEPATAGATLAPDRGYVVVKTAAPGRAYFNGVLAGETNVRLEVACGWRNLRLARPAMPGPGQSYPIWAGEGRPVLIACQSTTTLEMDGR